MASGVTIDRFRDHDSAETRARLARLFFATSTRQAFADDGERARFLETWLGRFLGADRDHAFLARDADGIVVGYLVGALDDPAISPRFSDIAFFASFADLTRSYPAHLHINVDADHRSAGTGARLIERFLAHAREHGVSGVHIVTGAEARNVGFYRRCGFSVLRDLPWHGETRLRFMGRALPPSES